MPHNEVSVEAGAPALDGLRRRRRPHAADEWTPRYEWTPRLLLVGVLVCATGLRVWGIRHGLPYAYNIDERAHYVPHSLDAADGAFNPRYFINPPAFTYVLAGVFAIVFGTDGQERFARDPSAVFLTARLVTVALSLGSIAATYAAGRAWFDRRVGLWAAAIVAVAFLPVFYARQALADAPALLPVALAVWMAARIAHSGRLREYAAAGAFAGAAAATKYTAGVVLVMVPCASVLAVRRDGTTRRATTGVLLAGVIALLAFITLNPYALLDWHTFITDIDSLQRFASGPPLIGQVEHNGFAYYATSFGWALGVIPTMAAAAGLATLIVRRRPQALAFAPLIIGFILYLGSHSRFYARWMLPLYPSLAIAAGYFVLTAGTAARRLPGRAARLATPILGAVLLVPTAVPTIRNAIVHTHLDTRTETRRWLVANVPRGSRVVFEPTAPIEWYGVTPGSGPEADRRRQWRRFHRTRRMIAEQARTFRGARTKADFLNYERTLSPALVDIYEHYRYCWVVTASTQSGQSALEVNRVPDAVAYYRRLRRDARLIFEASPVAKRGSIPRYQLDRSFNAYDAAYTRPGPLIKVYRLIRGKCATLG